MALCMSEPVEDPQVTRTAMIVALLIALSGLLLPMPIMLLAEECSLTAAGCWGRALQALGRLDMPLILLWNLLLGWTHLWLAVVALRILSEAPGRASLAGVSVGWAVVLLSKGAGEYIGLVEQGVLFLPLITGFVDIVTILAVRGWAARRLHGP